MVRFGLSLLVVLLLAGCTTGGSHPVVHSPYEGVPVATLFARWGAPVTAKPLADGGRVYLWFSGRFSAYIPGEDGTADLIGNTDWARGYPLRTYDPRLECRVRIFTRADGTIHTILMFEDSRGWWEFARCREVFGPPIRTPPGPPGSPVVVWAPNL